MVHRRCACRRPGGDGASRQRISCLLLRATALRSAMTSLCFVGSRQQAHCATKHTRMLPVAQPPLLNRPGMGAKLVTYYRKRDDADADFQKLKLGGWFALGCFEVIGPSGQGAERQQTKRSRAHALRRGAGLATAGKQAWQAGTVQALGKDDDSPFLGGMPPRSLCASCSTARASCPVEQSSSCCRPASRGRQQPER